jgi:hypothetical protein
MIEQCCPSQFWAKKEKRGQTRKIKGRKGQAGEEKGRKSRGEKKKSSFNAQFFPLVAVFLPRG